MSDCIFCRIVAGDLPAARVLETPEVLAFLDLAPVHYGHTLIIPKVHYPTLLELPGAIWEEMGQAGRRVAQALRTVLQAQGFNLCMNNLEAAGQVVFHAHLHIVPRYFGDGLQLFPQGSYRPGEMEKTAAQLRQSLAGG
jgi:histidine triad (HIT) family protein